MAWENPWAVDDARMASDVLRTFAYAATAGGEGVIDPGDFFPSAQVVPNGSVRVQPGAAMVLNRSAGVSSQSYEIQRPDAADVPIAATGSAARSDLVVARVEDPQFPGWQAPADPELGPYVHWRVIPGVPPGTTLLEQVAPTQTGYAVSRVDIPASANGIGTITPSMVKDLRVLSNPKVSPLVRMGGVAFPDVISSSQGRPWLSFRPVIWVPRWANEVQMIAFLGAIAHNGGDFNGVVTTTLGAIGPNQVRASNLPVDEEAPPSGGALREFTILGGGTVPPAYRGTFQPLGLDARRTAGTGTLAASRGTQVGYLVLFTQNVA